MPFLDPLPALPEANLPFPPGTPKEPWLRPKATPSPDALPPMFLAEAQDDVIVGRHLGGFYEALLAKGYLPEAHFYASSSHGFGMKPQGLTSDHWIAQFRAWMSAQGFDQSKQPKPFRDGQKDCPEMVAIPAGSFTMGADAGEDSWPEGPPHAVTIARPFAMATREVSNAEYEAFLKDTRREPTPGRLPWADPAFINPAARRQLTANSMTVTGDDALLRKAEASVRAMLAAAAVRLGVPASALTTAGARCGTGQASTSWAMASWPRRRAPCPSPPRSS